MTAASGCSKLSIVWLTLVGIAALASNGHAAEFRWVAVPHGGGAGNIGQTDPSCTISTTNHPDDTITCPDGGRRVHFSIGMFGWGNASGPNTQLGTWQATIDGTSLDNGSFVLNPINFPGGDRSVGGYQVLSTCYNGASDGLACGFAGRGPFGGGLPGVTAAQCQADGGLFCAPYAAFVLACCDPIAAVSTASLGYSWGTTTGPTAPFGRSDTGEVWYGGDYVLEIPAGATGTWDIQFQTDLDLTFMSDFEAAGIPLDALRAGIVRVPTGRCCSVLSGQAVCENGLTEGQCIDRPLFRGWTDGQTCTGPVAPEPADVADCAYCDPANPDDPFCDDGNACTHDTCTTDGCTHAPNYDTATECCNPTDGSIVMIDGGIVCATCTCDASTGQVTCVAGCDDGDACTDDTCADTTCQNDPNYDVDTECCNPTDGSIVVIGPAACCDPSDGSVADCDDGSACTDDACEDGVCQHAPNYDVATECCNPADGSTTYCDDGSACTADICDGGICLNRPTYNVDTECCNPVNGATVPIEDGDTCSYCACNPATGEVACGRSGSCAGFKWVAVPYGGGEGNIGQTDPSCTVVGGNVTCPHGGVRVHFQLLVRGPGDSFEIGTWQATLDGAALGSLVPIHFDTPADRPIGAYQVLEECFGGVSDLLACGSAGTGPYGVGLPGVTPQDCMNDGGFFCTPNSAFVLACCDPIAGVSTTTINYSWGATTGPGATGGQSDTGRFWYGADLVLDVPLQITEPSAVRFLDDPNLTFMSDFMAGAIGPIDIDDSDGGSFNFSTGRCCSGVDSAIVCENDVAQGACAARPGFQAWEEGQDCVGPVAPDPAGPDDCDICDATNPDDPICDDGDACTDDSCGEGGGCSHVVNYDVTTQCCDPIDGSTTVIDDGILCSVCVCDGATGQVDCTGGCDDLSVCTDDSCVDDVCHNVPNYDDATECCNPTDGSLATLDDAIPCTVCTCDVATGQVACTGGCPDDNNACTNDHCVADICLHSPNYSVATECCDPADGSVVPIDDGLGCTVCVCDATTGQVSCARSGTCAGYAWIAAPFGGGEGRIGQTDPSCTIGTTVLPGDTITCPEGGVRVHFKLMMYGWDDGSGRELGTYQATLDGADMGWLVPIHFDTPANRPIGAYQVLEECFSGTSNGLACGIAGTGPYGPGLPGVTPGGCLADGGLFCATNAEFVLSCCDPIAAVGTTSVNYSWGSTTGPGAVFGCIDLGTLRYAGDLVLEIPPGAKGSSRIRFLNDPNFTFMSTSTAGPINLNVGQLGFVHVPVGKCCSVLGSSVICENDLTQGVCAAKPRATWTAGQECVGPIWPDPASIDDCALCDLMLPNDPLCDDGNPCTHDDCTPDGCRSMLNYDDTTVCCNPSDGSMVSVDDGVYCTDCTCDPSNGTVTCGPSADGTRCDDGVGCTLNDVCTAGVCDGEAVAETPCASDDDCGRFVGCDAETGFCECPRLSQRLYEAR